MPSRARFDAKTLGEPRETLPGKGERDRVFLSDGSEVTHRSTD